MTLTEKINLGEELADANRKKIIASIESLSDIRLNTGTMSIEKNNLVEKLEELTAKLDELSVKRIYQRIELLLPEKRNAYRHFGFYVCKTETLSKGETIVDE